MTLMQTEKARVEQAIKRCEAKLAAAEDELSRYYYRCCLEGWRRHLARLSRDSGSDAV